MPILAPKTTQMLHKNKAWSKDEYWQEFDIKDICEKVIDYAANAGVRVVDKIDPVEYGKFLKDREEIIKKELAEIQAAKEAKLLRG